MKTPTKRTRRSGLRAKDVMTRELVTVREDEDVHVVAERLVKNRISGAPVLDAAGDLSGMISQADLAVFLWSKAMEKAGYPALSAAGVRGAERVPMARDLMTRTVIKAGDKEPLPALARTMLRRRVHRILIMRGRRPIGIVTTMDLLKGR